MNEKEHISETDYYIFQHGIMNQTDKVKFLEHICSCNYCADQFATLISSEIIAAPRDMKSNILKATKRPEIQLAVKARETSKRMQLFIYSLKVGTATVCALLLLLLTMNISHIDTTLNIPENTLSEVQIDKEDNESLTSTIRDGMDTISNNMLDFSNNIMKTEVTDND
ncbi:MAG: hypothetical protein PHF63_06155 [Herbinix sp.]|nr:hypothetical protein [Herbinix sp.]